ncbi:MAG TPA: GntR family transcriptional regulator [Jiangellaceae bacterium]
MAVTRGTGRSKKELIADELRARVLDGTVPEGEKLTTEAEVIEQYQVARNTARDALALLVSEGLIVARRPHGYFVRDRNRMQYRPQSDLRKQTAANQDVFLTEQEQEGRAPSQRIEVSIVKPPVEVKDRLKLDDSEYVVVRRRLRYLDGDLVYSNDSYFPQDVVQGTEIMEPHDLTPGANHTLAANGHVQVRAVDEILVRMPTPDEAQRLDLAPGTPIAQHIITGYDQDDRPVRCVMSILPGDRHVIIYERDGLPLPKENAK